MKRLQHKLLILLLFLICSSANAGKLDLMMGYFSLSAKNNIKSGTASGIGAYRLTYLHNFYRNLEAGVGYTVLMSNTIGGDVEYGLDLMINYFPFTSPAPKIFVTKDISVKVYDLWRPYVGVGFAQRQVQSVKVSYAGFSVQGGVERRIDSSLSLKSELRVTEMVGETQGTATEMGVYMGVSFSW